MCGIAGYYNIHNDNGLIDIMTDAIRHRGPDSSGKWISDDGKVILGHCRLAILDPTESGLQPMTSSSGRYVISYNGEIYNHLSLRKEMMTKGVQFRGSSDTETLVEAIELYGLNKTLAIIKGMFAFALYDSHERVLYLVRDRAGEKPLYYGRVNGRLCFASDLASIQAIPDNDLTIDPGSLELYFRRGYVPAPFSIYKGMYKVIPGHYIKIQYPFDVFEDNVYWSCAEVAIRCHNNPFRGSFTEASEELDRLLRKTVKEQMISDVPLGAFLSAGIDSSAIVSVMSEISSDPVHTFTIGLGDETDMNEAPVARKIASILGTDHTEEYVSSSQIMKAIPTISRVYSEPHGDSSQIPSYIICSIARKNVTVMLSGDSGDELFCGYEKYYRWVNGEIDKHRRFPPTVQKLRSGLLEFRGDGRSVKARKLRADSLGSLYSALAGWDTSFVNTDQIYKDSIDSYEEPSDWDPYDSMMLMDFREYMPDDNLAKIDRAAMFCSLETRVPLLDRDIIEFAWSLPLGYKYYAGITKRVLRSVLYKYIPKEVMDRPKSGFSIPIGKWLKTGELRLWAESIINSEDCLPGELFDRSRIRKMWSDYISNDIWTESIWYLLMFGAWKEETGK